MHLKRPDDLARGLVERAGLLDPVTVLGQGLLDTCDRGWLGGGSAGEIFVDGAGVGPGADPALRQRLPRKQRAWGGLAQRRDIAVADDIVGADAVALDEVSGQTLDQVELRGLIGMPAAPRCFVGIAKIDDLDAQRRVVQIVASIPIAHAGMPRALVVVDQLQRDRLAAVRAWIRGDEIMGAGAAGGQQPERLLIVDGGVMQNEVADSFVLTHGPIGGGVSLVLPPVLDTDDFRREPGASAQHDSQSCGYGD
ncbi:hypothetical protein PATSB16_18050 [Pandoraea thiooxydans]|nr:hypothetical protein PATSB16_18050 [Pandoraea thiooxydans]